MEKAAIDHHSEIRRKVKSKVFTQQKGICPSCKGSLRVLSSDLENPDKKLTREKVLPYLSLMVQLDQKELGHAKAVL